MGSRGLHLTLQYIRALFVSASAAFWVVEIPTEQLFSEKELLSQRIRAFTLVEMAGVGLTWRLQGGYSRFLKGSLVELRLQQGLLRQRLDVYPLAIADRSRPIDLQFEAARTLRGRGPGNIAWRIRPAGSIRARILFAGNAFLGNFRVPKEHLAIQWDVEASAEAGAARQRSRLLLDLNAGTRLYHSWVTLFSQEILVDRALREAWKSFRYPLDSAEVYLMPEGQVVRWRWSGRVRLAMDVQWSLASGWAIPGISPVARVQAELTPSFAGARWETVEEGEFSIQLRRKNQETQFRLRRHRQRTRRSDLSAGISLGSQSRVIRLSPNSPDALRVVTKTFSRPLLRTVNRVAREALSRRLEIALAVERTHWKGATTMVSARWSARDGRAFQDTYSRLLSGDLPQPGKGLKISGRIENFRGREWAIRLNFLNWIEMGKSTRSETRQALVVDPTGGILLEQTQELEKTRSKWDEIQFLRLLHRETIQEGRRSLEFLWSYGRRQRFSRHSLDQLLRMALRVGIIPECGLPATSSFPLTAELLLVTRFSPSGLSRVRHASPERNWPSRKGTNEEPFGGIGSTTRRLERGSMRILYKPTWRPVIRSEGAGSHNAGRWSVLTEQASGSWNCWRTGVKEKPKCCRPSDWDWTFPYLSFFTCSARPPRVARLLS